VGKAGLGTFAATIWSLAELARRLLKMDERAREIEVMERQYDGRPLAVGDLDEAGRQADQVVDMDDIRGHLDDGVQKQLLEAFVVDKEAIRAQLASDESIDRRSIGQLFVAHLGDQRSRPEPPRHDADRIAALD
jgi:hypothetical protein